MDEGNRKRICTQKMCVCVCVVMSEWVDAEKEVAAKVEVKREQQKATATDERDGRREQRRRKKRRGGGRPERREGRIEGYRESLRGEEEEGGENLAT